jgi:alkanesulfonate monooxygenase SsuD/methylene tetrahydromethanopterin reductase-like flavin-dependent oxidoreductase (luciferase family)
MKNDIQTPITESLIREVLTSYDKYRGQYRLNTLLVMTPDEIIKQIAEDLKKEHAKDKR